MPAINRIQLERDNDTGVHEVKSGERLEPAEPEPGTEKEPPADERPQRRDEKREAPARETPPRRSQSGEGDQEEFERATTPFPGG